MQRAKAVVALLGKEGAGKSRFVASLTGKAAYSSNFRGSTVQCEAYETPQATFVDTPGILRQSDSQTTAMALAQLAQHDCVILVAQATHIDSDLGDLLPLVQGKRGLVVVTFWDRVSAAGHGASLESLARAAGSIEVVPVDARNLGVAERERIMAALENPKPFPEKLPLPAGWRVEPKPTVLERRRAGPAAAAALIMLPSVAAAAGANAFAERVDPLVKALARPAADALLSWLPAPLGAILAGDYGFITMGPLLFVWAVPTILIYSFLLGAYKASGLLERVSAAVHPLLRPLGMSGRDLVRVVMGFGCNVPAVISTRACSSCSRGATISAIAFGSACSYQFGATIGVFAAAGKPWLVVPFVLFLAATTLLYTRAASSRAGRSRLNALVIADNRTFLEWPSARSVWMESRMTIYQFFRLAIPIFAGITVLASVLDWLGVIDALAGVLAPAMSVFGLPGDAALAVVFGSIRKDGLLLLAEPGLASSMSSLQVLTSVYIAGVLLPCLVTLLTIAREQGGRFAARLAGRQAAAAVLFTLLLAWGGRLLAGHG